MAFINKYLNVRMTADVSDLGKAKVYDAGDCATPKLHVRGTPSGDHACGLVASPVNDARKLIVTHSVTDAQGVVTKKRHYVHVMSGGLQYTLLQQLEGGVLSGDGIQRLNIGKQSFRSVWLAFNENYDITFDDIPRWYATQLGPSHISS